MRRRSAYLGIALLLTAAASFSVCWGIQAVHAQAMQAAQDREQAIEMIEAAGTGCGLTRDRAAWFAEQAHKIRPDVTWVHAGALYALDIATRCGGWPKRN